MGYGEGADAGGVSAVQSADAAADGAGGAGEGGPGATDYAGEEETAGIVHEGFSGIARKRRASVRPDLRGVSHSPDGGGEHFGPRVLRQISEIGRCAAAVDGD